MSSHDTSHRLLPPLREVSGLVSAYLFGSAATGREHRESDLDVAVLVDRTVYPTPADRFDLRLTVMASVHGSTGREVDLVILNDAPPQLARRVMTEGRKLLSNDPQQEHAHLRMVLSRAADLEPFLRRTRAVKLRAVER
jgi:predicted nucleotidyltransferase